MSAIFLRGYIKSTCLLWPQGVTCSAHNQSNPVNEVTILEPKSLHHIFPFLAEYHFLPPAN